MCYSQREFTGCKRKASSNPSLFYSTLDTMSIKKRVSYE